MRSLPAAANRGARQHRAVVALGLALAGSIATVPAPADAAPLSTPLAGRRSCAHADAPSYTVADGDSWFVIAEHVGVAMRSLLRANDATADASLYPGDVVCLPADATLPVAATGAVCANGTGTYTVVAGDSWFVIAHAVGVGMSSLLQVNDATASTSLHPGDDLCLPSGAKPPSSNSDGSSSDGSNSASDGSSADAGDESASTARVALPKGAATVRAFPVQGPCWFADTWLAPRGNGRRHVGVDLLARTGQYVYAVTDGTLTQRAWDQPGLLAGNAWWLTAGDGTGTYYFYGHLSAFAPGLKVGSRVVAGQIIGFVGETGSAAAPHVHFEMHPNGGGPVNPYSTMKAMAGCTIDEPYQQPGGWTPA